MVRIAQVMSCDVSPRRFAICLVSFFATLGVICSASPASALTVWINAVDVLPTPPIRSLDDVSLEIALGSATIDLYLVSPTVVDIFGNSISVDVYADVTCKGICPTVVDNLTEIVPLGTFSPGTYDFSVTSYHVGGDTVVNGSFTVVPEPSTALLLRFGLVALAAGRRRR